MGNEAIALAATLRSVPMSVAAQSFSVGDQSQNESVDGQGKNAAASGLLVDLTIGSIQTRWSLCLEHCRQSKSTPGKR